MTHGQENGSVQAEVLVLRRWCMALTVALGTLFLAGAAIALQDLACRSLTIRDGAGAVAAEMRADQTYIRDKLIVGQTDILAELESLRRARTSWFVSKTGAFGVHGRESGNWSTIPDMKLAFNTEGKNRRVFIQFVCNGHEPSHPGAERPRAEGISCSSQFRIVVDDKVVSRTLQSFTHALMGVNCRDVVLIHEAQELQAGPHNVRVDWMLSPEGELPINDLGLGISSSGGRSLYVSSE